MTDWQLGLIIFIVSVACAIALNKMQKRLPIRRWERIVNNNSTYQMTLMAGLVGAFLFWRGLLTEVPLPGVLLLVLVSLLSAFTVLGVYVPVFRRAARQPSRANGAHSELYDLIERIGKK